LKKILARSIMFGRTGGPRLRGKRANMMECPFAGESLSGSRIAARRRRARQTMGQQA
jgi:hypothetical protein